MYLSKPKTIFDDIIDGQFPKKAIINLLYLLSLFYSKTYEPSLYPNTLRFVFVKSLFLNL